MAKFNYKFGGIPQWRPRGFSQDELRTFGVQAVGIMVARIKSGVNVHDAQAKPLKAPWGQKASVVRNSYPFQKAKKGLRPIRDWTYTGQTLAAMGIVELGGNQVAIGIGWRAHPEQFRIALFNQAIEPMGGLSPRDREQLRDIIRRTYLRRAA